jgi:hypothetical protein
MSELEQTILNGHHDNHDSDTVDKVVTIELLGDPPVDNKDSDGTIEPDLPIGSPSLY